jgi:DNA polymerase-1
MSRSTLLVVDGTAVAYRAYFAIRNLSTAAGQPTNALFGFIRMFTQLGELCRPTHQVVVFDGGSPAWRKALLPDYKAQRPPMPDGLRSQLPLVDRYLDAASVTHMRIDGQEADDAMATVASRARVDGADVLLATSDKDMYQLVDKQLRIMPPSGKADPMGPDDVRAKTGVRPDQVVDWLAMIGDSADNIPGVPGVGPKTASKLLAAFGTLDEIWQRLEEIPQDGLRGKLDASRELVARNRDLVRLRTDVDVGIGWRDTLVRPSRVDALLEFLNGVEFHSMARSLREPDLFG